MYPAPQNSDLVALTSAQRDLLINLVNHYQAGEIKNPIILVPSGPAEYVIYVRNAPSLRITRLSDLDDLCAAELLSYQLNRMGTGKLYQLTKASQKAAALFHHLPDDLPPMHWSALVADRPDQSTLKARFHLFRSLRMKLRHEMTAVLPNHRLAEMVELITATTHTLESDSPSAALVTNNVRQLGQLLIDHFQASQAERQSQAFILYGNWVRVIFQILDQLRHLRRVN